MRFRRKRDADDPFWGMRGPMKPVTPEEHAEDSWAVMGDERHKALLHRSYLRTMHSPSNSSVGPFATPRANPDEDTQQQIAELVRAALDTPTVRKPRRYLCGGPYAGVLILDPLIVRRPLTIDDIPAYVDRHAERETRVLQQMCVLVSDGVISVIEDENSTYWEPTRLHRDPGRTLEKLCLRALTADPIERLRFAALVQGGRWPLPRHITEATGLRNR